MLNRIISRTLLQITYVKAYIKLEGFLLELFFTSKAISEKYLYVYNITVNIGKKNIYFVFALKQIHFEKVWNVWFQIH